jgi:hypothetical protein
MAGGEEFGFGRRRFPGTRVGRLVLFGSILGCSLAVQASKPAPPRRPDSDAAARASQPSTGWHAGNEWILAGNYAETCSDPPLCPGLFGAASSSGTCRKLMVFQVTNGRYHRTNLAGLAAIVAAESPAGAPVMPGNRPDWKRCELYVSDQADSAQADALSRVLGAMLAGVDGPPFTSVTRTKVAVNFSAARVIGEAADLVKFYMHPVPSMNRIRPPDLNNVGTTFRFLGPLYVYEADTLHFGAAEPPWSYEGRSAVVSQFTWNSEVANVGTANEVKP